jgi:hypothetical protein
MKQKNTMPKVLAVLFVIIGLASCQEDFSTLTTDVIDQPVNSKLDDSKAIVSYSRKLLPVETNNLIAYQLGIYNDATFGKSTVNLQAQVTLSEINPDFGDNVILDSVVLYIPYAASATIEDGVTTFELDSVYGNSPVDVTIYESNYFLRDFDPASNFDDPQLYYSNQANTFENFLGMALAEEEDFVPSNEEIVFFEDDDEKEIRINPGFRVLLPNKFFQEKVFDQEGMAVLLNNNNFREFFRGVYFDVQSNTDDGNLFLFDIDDANITLHYTRDREDTDDDAGDDGDEDTIADEYVLEFGAINVNVFKNHLTPSISASLFNPDINNGEETLFVRGGDGIITVVELFDKTDIKSIEDGVLVDGENGVSDELDALRIEEWLINEANLIFYVDKDNVQGGDTEPERLFIYNIETGAVLADYALDLTGGSVAIDAYTEHMGRLQRGSDDNGDFYKLRITTHLSHVINRDSTNVPLAVMVSSNVGIQEYQQLENPQVPGIYSVPASAVVSPEGTVLHGNTSANEARRLKLQIYYTELNED